ncbi:hypothetical protein ACUY4R_004229 [Kosakonia sp. BK9b]
MSSRITFQKQPCPVARSVDVLGDRWALLIVRDAQAGVRRFSDFQRELGVARNILTDRLRTLVDIGIFITQPATDGMPFQEYVLTEKGESLYPAMIPRGTEGSVRKLGP